MPTCNTACGRRSARAAAVRAAASTGPTPHSTASASTAPRSSAWGAATTRVTPAPVSRPSRRSFIEWETLDRGERTRTDWTPLTVNTITVTVDHDHATVALTGEHEAYSADRLTRSLGGLLDEGVSVTVDLHRTAFIDSTVVGVL